MKNIIVGQSGGPTAVINSSLAGVFAAARDKKIQNIYGMVNGIDGLLKGNFIDLKDYLKTKEDIALLKRTPSAILGSCRFKLPDMEKGRETYEKLFQILNELEIGYFIYIGGNDSMDTILKLSRYAESIGSNIRFIGVPKTIDNDLAETDHTPGYGSAAKYVAASLKEIIRDSNVYDMKSVTVVEIMGRNAGWLTAAAGLAKDEDCPGPDLIYLPERTFEQEEFLKDVDHLLKEKNTVVVAVSESLKDKNGVYLCDAMIKNAKEDSFGHKILSGTALAVSELVTTKLNVKSRGIIFNTLQRCATHLASLTDSNEAFLAGEEAVKAAVSGETGKMVILRRMKENTYIMVPELFAIEKVANEEKTVPDEYINSSGNGVTEAFLEYARPLIQGELNPIMENGLPKHFVIKKS
ncbi:MAG: 6-phosphofructokinase [Clostridia bacterium]|nr:6-phosphofructokinase [Clostridia bacterium]